ncbi:MAG: choline/ethanolamine kinase family protein [Actinoallomurus sp.]
MALSVAEIMARAGLGSGGEVACTTLKGGLSHCVLRVDADGTSYVLRVLDPAVSMAGLGVPAPVEIDNTARAAITGVGPAVLYAGEDLMVLEYIDGVTLGHDDVRRPAMIPRLAAACRRLHAGPAGFAGDFSVFRKAEELFARCREHDLPVPDGYADHLPVLAVIERAMERVPLRRVPCHNDLLPENFIDAGDAIRIVDFQLSGMNDPAFELGDIAAEGDYDPGRVEALASAYFGTEMSEALLARVRLYLLASNVTWTLWFAIHHGLLAAKAADATFDYDAEAADKWQQALRDLTDPGLGRLIDLAAHRGAASPQPTPPSRRH